MDSPMNINTPGYRVSASTTTANTQFSSDDSNVSHVLVHNDTSATAWVVSGKGSAPTAAFPSAGSKAKGKTIPAGQYQTWSKNPDHDYVAVILASGTGDVYFYPGTGE